MFIHGSTQVFKCIVHCIKQYIKYLLYKIFRSTSFSIYYKYYDLLVYISGKRQYLHLQYLIFATFQRGNPHKVEEMHIFFIFYNCPTFQFFKDVKYIPFFILPIEGFPLLHRTLNISTSNKRDISSQQRMKHKKIWSCLGVKLISEYVEERIPQNMSIIFPNSSVYHTVVLISSLYFVLLNYTYKSWSIIKTRDSFGICLS